MTTFSFKINPTTKVCRLTDTTDYSVYGLVPSTNQMSLLGEITFQGEVLYSKTTTVDPLIDLKSGATFFEFPAELDANGEVANGVYSITNSQTFFAFGATGVTSVASTQTFTIPSYGGVAPLLENGGTGSIVKSSPSPVLTINPATILSAEASSGILTMVIESGTTDYTGGVVIFSLLTPEISQSWTYKGCTQISAQVALTPDCEYGDFGTWTVTNETEITTQTISSLNATINYPSWTGEDPIVVTSLPYSNNRLATGTYSVTLTEVITQTEADGLILEYTASCTEEFKVTCANSLCGLAPCIEALREAHAAELSRNKISKYQVYVDNVNLYYLKAVAYQKCGEYDLYKAALADIKATLDASGCDCGCCDEDALIWVENTSAQTITAIEQLQEDLQYRLFNGVPGATQDESLGVKLGAVWQDINTGIEYRCIDPTAGAAVWEVYYDVTPTIAAEDVSFSPNPLILGTNVQDAIDDTLSLTASLDSQISNLSTQIGNLTTAVNSKVESVTGTKVDNTNPLNPVVEVQDASETPFTPIPALGPADTVQEAIEASATLALSKVTSVVGLNTNNSDPENPVIQISVDGTTITGSGTPASPLVANVSLPYTNFVALISNGTTVNSIYNNTGATFSISNVSTGWFIITASSPIFAVNKTYVSYSPASGLSGDRSVTVSRQSTTELYLYNYVDGVLTNTVAQGYIEIRIYP